jgi:hypothetical protein
MERARQQTASAKRAEGTCTLGHVVAVPRQRRGCAPGGRAERAGMTSLGRGACRQGRAWGRGRAGQGRARGGGAHRQGAATLGAGAARRGGGGASGG